MKGIHHFGFGLVATLGSILSMTATAQEPAGGDLPAPLADQAQPASAARGDARVRPLMEGPLHEAFLSPRKDRSPYRIEKSPPPPLSERPAIDPPNASADWIEGYWEWDGGKKDFVWVTGTWRVAPPGRFWVNGYWKRDDQGWYRVPGFWSERKTDRVDFRKNGPPEQRPDEEPGEPPAPDCFYIPGQYYPDGDGVVWKKGYWSKVQSGWSWVPSQWVRQPDGWVFQEGYWDRILEDRGTLFAPAKSRETRVDRAISCTSRIRRSRPRCTGRSMVRSGGRTRIMTATPESPTTTMADITATHPTDI